MQRNQQLLECPITLSLFIDPVTLPDCGHSFERAAIREHCEDIGYSCPLCRAHINTPISHVATSILLREIAQQARSQLKADDQDIDPAVTPSNLCDSAPLSKVSRFSIFIKGQAHLNNYTEIRVKPDDDIIDVKNKYIEYHKGYCCHQNFRLIKNGNVLRPDSTIQGNDIRDKEVITTALTAPCPHIR